jgi:DNA processing protein
LSLQATLGLRPQYAIECLERYPDPSAALRSSDRASPGGRAELDRAQATLRRVAALALPFHCPEYPARLRTLVDAPPLLLVRGSPADLSQLSVAIVGARAASAYGLVVARGLAAELARAGVVVVSGLARGIDAAAHEGALDAGGRTIAVQACGPERIYPSEHRRLAERIQDSGALVTEFSPGTRPLPAFFPMRNRLISKLARVVIVVEARLRSGSLITARHALDQGGEVMAVPGPISAPTSAGPNALIRDGAQPVLGASDVLNALGLSPSLAAPSPSAGVAPEQLCILEALRHRPRSRDELDRELALPAGELQLHLLELELAGRVIEDRDGRFVPVADLTG